MNIQKKKIVAVFFYFGNTKIRHLKSVLMLLWAMMVRIICGCYWELIRKRSSINICFSLMLFFFIEGIGKIKCELHIKPADQYEVFFPCKVWSSPCFIDSQRLDEALTFKNGYFRLRTLHIWDILEYEEVLQQQWRQSRVIYFDLYVYMLFFWQGCFSNNGLHQRPLNVFISL